MSIRNLAMAFALAFGGLALLSPSAAEAGDVHVGFSYHGRHHSVRVGYSSHRDCHGYSYARASTCAPVVTCAPAYRREPLVYHYAPDFAPRYTYVEPCAPRVLYSSSFTPAPRYYGHSGSRYGGSHYRVRYSRGYGCR